MNITPLHIFFTISTVLTLVVVIAIACLIYSSVLRPWWIERRELKRFAASLPADERANFWRIHKQRTKRGLV